MREAALAAISTLLIATQSLAMQAAGPTAFGPSPMGAAEPQQARAETQSASFEQSNAEQSNASSAIGARPLGMPAGAGVPAIARPASESQPLGAPAETNTDSGIAQTLVVLLAIVVVIAGGAQIIKRLARGSGGFGATLGAGGRAPSGVLSVLGRYPVGPGHQVVLLRVDRRVLVLSQSMGRLRSGGGSFTTLAEITDPEDVASILVRTQDETGESMNARFHEMLGRFGEQHDEPTQAADAPHQPSLLRDRLNRVRTRTTDQPERAERAW